MEKKQTLRCFFPTVAWIKPSKKRARFYPQFPPARISLSLYYGIRGTNRNGVFSEHGAYGKYGNPRKTRGFPHFPQARKQAARRGLNMLNLSSSGDHQQQMLFIFRGHDHTLSTLFLGPRNGEHLQASVAKLGNGCDFEDSAPRSGARNLARGTRFLRTPGTMVGRDPHPARVRGLLATLAACRRSCGVLTRGCAALNPWLISSHPFGVSFATETS